MDAIRNYMQKPKGGRVLLAENQAINMLKMDLTRKRERVAGEEFGVKKGKKG